MPPRRYAAPASFTITVARSIPPPSWPRPSCYEHWRMVITDATATDGLATLVVGLLEGTVPVDLTHADLRQHQDTIRLQAVKIEYHDAEDGEAAMTILECPTPVEFLPGSVLGSPCKNG